jgi:hypothetical protein
MRVLPLAVATLLAAPLLTACGSAAPPAEPVSVSATSCGAHWTRPPAHTAFACMTADRPVHPGRLRDIEPLGPGTTASVDVSLSAGRYAWRCLMADDSLPAVSFVKAAEYQDGHAGYSDPIDEQHFLVHEINLLQNSPEWKNTAVVIAYDESDGWYDHAFAAPANGSSTGLDSSMCSSQATVTAGYQGRCGPGPRLPMLVVSPWAKTNFVDHTTTEQSSITKFI